MSLGLAPARLGGVNASLPAHFGGPASPVRELLLHPGGEVWLRQPLPRPHIFSLDTLTTFVIDHNFSSFLPTLDRSRIIKPVPCEFSKAPLRETERAPSYVVKPFSSNRFSTKRVTNQPAIAARSFLLLYQPNCVASNLHCSIHSPDLFCAYQVRARDCTPGHYPAPTNAKGTYPKMPS